MKVKNWGILWLTIIFCQALQAQNLPQWKLEAREDLYAQDWERQEESSFNAKTVHQKNRLMIQAIEKSEVNPQDHRATALSPKEIRKLYNYAVQHPIAGIQALKKYDPEGHIGFCFGRALFVHLELLRRGVSKDSIKKVFVVGEMIEGTLGSTEVINWQFHVATAVRDTNGEWWVIDPSYELMKIRDWYRYMRTMSPDKTLSLFVTQTAKIGPSAWEYNTQPGGLLDSFYNDYFKDLFAYFKKNKPVKDYRKKSAIADGQSCRRATAF